MEFLSIFEEPPKIHRRLGGYVVDGDYSVIPR